jgi:hypothetical protein
MSRSGTMNASTWPASVVTFTTGIVFSNSLNLALRFVRYSHEQTWL